MLDDLRDQTALVSVAAWRHEPGCADPELGARGGRAPGRPQAARRRRRRPGGRPAPHHITSFVARNFPETTGEPEPMSLTPAAAQNLRQALATVVAVPVTPLPGRREPRLGHLRRADRRLIDGGITVITPNGNTGEFYALSPAEARQAAETAAARPAAGGPSSWPASATTSPPRSRRPGTPGTTGARMIMIHQPVHPYVSPGRLDRLPRRHRRRGARPRGRPLRPERAHHRGATSPRSPTGRRTSSASSTPSATPARSPRWPGTPGSTGSPGWPARPS